MSNLENWNKLCRPPAEALKKITGGRLSGMTDVNPQWRLKVMTDVFGQIGIGWYYEVQSMWVEAGAGDQKMAFVHIHLHTKINEKDGWSKPISGIGGSMLVVQEKNGMHTSDEAFKMATTDALSVAMKQLGVAADIYAGLWDGSKYKNIPSATPPIDAESEYVKWTQTKSLLVDNKGEPNKDGINKEWLKIPLPTRTAIVTYGKALAESEKLKTLEDKENE